MKNAAAVLSTSWVNKTDKEAEEWGTWDKKKQKKWTDEYLKTSLEVWAMVVANATEAQGRISTIKDHMKAVVDGAEKLLAARRKSNTPLSDEERSFLKKGEATILGAQAAVSAVTEEYSKNSPFAGRAGYFDVALNKGALTKPMVDKIKAARARSIDIGATFGKAGPLTARMEEYRKRWGVLKAELDGLEKQRDGKAHEWAADLTRRIKAFADSNAAWEHSLETELGKVSGNLERLHAHVDATSPKSFGDALLKGLKATFDSKARAQAKEENARNAIAVKAYLGNLANFLKASKGTLKTRLMEFKALSASIDDVGPNGAPFKKVLAPLGLKLAEHQKTIDQLVVDVAAAVKLAGK